MIVIQNNIKNPKHSNFCIINLFQHVDLLIYTFNANRTLQTNLILFHSLVNFWVLSYFLMGILSISSLIRDNLLLFLKKKKPIIFFRDIINGTPIL